MSTASERPLSVRNNDNKSSSAPRRSRKRVKTKHRPTTQKSRTVSTFDKLPMELILMILSYLTPTSLLALMPVCRAFYDPLSGRSAPNIWKAARWNERVPIPAPPPDLTEPQWANFLWTNHCQICRASKKLTILFSLRKRVCVKCLSENLIYCGASKTAALVNKVPFASTALLPLLVPSDKDKSGGHLLCAACRLDGTYDYNIIEATRKYYWIPDITSMLRTVSTEHPEVFLGCAGTVSPSAMKEYEAFVKERTAHIQRRLHHAYECCGWARNMNILAHNLGTFGYASPDHPI